MLLILGLSNAKLGLTHSAHSDSAIQRMVHFKSEIESVINNYVLNLKTSAWQWSVPTEGAGAKMTIGNISMGNDRMRKIIEDFGSLYSICVPSTAVTEEAYGKLEAMEVQAESEKEKRNKQSRR